MRGEYEELARRLSELEQKVALLSCQERFAVGHGVRKRASWGIGTLPFFDIAFGPDLQSGQTRGNAKGIIANGDIATGIVAIGALARGVIAIGGLAIGLVGFGGLCVSPLLAIGGLAVGGMALGGGAVGGGAVGYYACGAGSTGEHFVDVMHRDPSVSEFLHQFGLEALCPVR